ncbi:MAG: sugar phosphate isomerase/epimerase family protein [Sedimentisphaerales bacterium]|nr:sugar phosphate isomerase/epimerase family protein [Sedimentisphaerales bacterium]
MNSQVNRRHFLQQSSLALAGASLGTILGGLSVAESVLSKGRYKKALGYTMINEDLSVEDKLKLIKDIGFEGVEIPTQFLNKGTPEPKVLARASEKVGIPVHGVVNSSHPDIKGAIDEAVLYGASSVLHVVRPKPEGSFMENYRSSQDAIRKAIPYAEKKRIHILVENVWSTFLIEPLTMARYIDEIDSQYVKAYFDVGNVVRWGWPQHWIEVLGRRIAKIHIKEYNLKVAMSEGMGKGFAVPIGQGSIDWKRVREELMKIGYRDWATAEVSGGNRERLAEISQQMDQVLAL